MLWHSPSRLRALDGSLRIRDLRENLAAAPASIARLPQAVASLWLRSPLHRRNLLARDAAVAGLGSARANGELYVTLDLAS
jgi:uncharacterized protein YkwD